MGSSKFAAFILNTGHISGTSSGKTIRRLNHSRKFIINYFDMWQIISAIFQAKMSKIPFTLWWYRWLLDFWIEQNKYLKDFWKLWWKFSDALWVKWISDWKYNEKKKYIMRITVSCSPKTFRFSPLRRPRQAPADKIHWGSGTTLPPTAAERNIRGKAGRSSPRSLEPETSWRHWTGSPDGNKADHSQRRNEG